VAAYLEKHGFQRVALSDIIREVAAAEGIQEPTVAQMQDLGDRMRQNDGPAVLASQALSRWDRTRSIVLDGIKNWGEADYLRRNEAGFHLVAVDASEETREKRKVGVVSGMLTSADFAAAEQRDRAETDAWGVLIEEGQQVEKCVRDADFVLWNDHLLLRGTGEHLGQDGSLETLQSKVDRLLKTLGAPERFHPTFDEILMSQAVVASMYSQCMQRRVGAVLANTKGQVLAVGQNNVPFPLQSCRAQIGRCHRREVRELQIADAVSHFVCSKCAGNLSLDLRCEKCGLDHSAAFEGVRNLDFCRAIHAEEAALLDLVHSGASTRDGLRLYSTTFPCALCAKKIVHAGVQSVVFIDPYQGTEAYSILRDTDKRVEHFEGFTLKGILKVWGNQEPV